MIDEADARLRDWIKTLAGPVDVSLGPPRDVKTDRSGVNLYLLEVLQTQQPRGPTRPPLEVILRYLITTWAEDPVEAHRMLGALVFAAMDEAEYDVESERVTGDVWLALGISPRPSFVLRVPLRKERPKREAKLVQTPAVLKTMPLASFYGVLLGPKDTPVAEAQVEIPALQLQAATDGNGRFVFTTVPAEPRRKVLRVRAKGREFSITADTATSQMEPLVIRFNPREV